MWAAAALLAALLRPGAAPAIDLEKLVMPGRVVRSHADVEAQCEKCHARFEVAAQDDLCIACHEDVGEDMRTGAGFHGRAPGAVEALCRTCHTDHKGRDADIVGLDRAAFDHDLTDHPLRGAHQRAVCESCHEPQKRRREAPTACFACHEDDDVHRGDLGQECGNCHGPESWRESRFDHDTTRFPLRGRHVDVECALCHPSARYEGTTRACNGCHRLNDPHLGRFGTRCDDCHSTERWDRTRFDHDRDTRFPLRARHRQVACERCHTGPKRRGEPPRECFGCHRADDAHRGRNGTRCETCHGADSWSAEKFDHDASTKFALRGAHRDAKCDRCHTGTLGREELETACRACHRRDDVHAGQQGSDCARCHNERGWNHQVFFEHDLTRFPLLGLHAALACEECHTTPRYRDVASRCADCHARDDVHRRRLGVACARCHNPNGWPLVRFDHARDTGFVLEGAHAPLECVACHRTPAKDAAGSVAGCAGCHRADDPHFGAFGRDCRRCHDQTSWRGAAPGR